MNKPKRKLSQFSKKEFNRIAKRRFRKEFGRKITVTEINEIVNNWLKYHVFEPMLKGECVKIDKNSTIQVIGTPIMNDKAAVELLSSGKYITRNGKFKKADNINSKRRDYKYKIVYNNALAKGKVLRFKACPKLAKMVHETLVNTNTYFRLNVN